MQRVSFQVFVLSESKIFAKNYFLVQREKVLIHGDIIFQKLFKNFNVEFANLKSNSQQKLIFRHRARWKKKILSSVIQDEEIHLQFSFSSFFLWSVLALNAEVDDFIFFHSIGFFVGPISTRAWGYPEIFSFGPITKSVKHQMANLEEKNKKYTWKSSAWNQERSPLLLFFKYLLAEEL